MTQPERPIQSDAEDVLARGPFVQRIVSALIDGKTKRATGVVIGITGPWGSGKSSVLNLLQRAIKIAHPNAIVVRFDPWLISNRDDLVASFIKELLAAITLQPTAKKRLKSVTTLFARYGKALSPVGNLLVPGGAAVIQGASSAIDAASSARNSLTSLRARLIGQLDQIHIPIVALIDELDRIEDREIRTVAQLIRSIADFRGMSYVLAYDTKRVVQALGEGVSIDSSDERETRGRAYLEKIVQLQIPLPITFGEELGTLLRAEIESFRDEINLPVEFEKSERYGDISKILILDVLQTPRDVKRLVGTFHVLAGMLGNEVDLVDLLAYSALLVKAPGTVDHIRNDPEDFVEDTLSEKAVLRQLNDKKAPLPDRLSRIVARSEDNQGTRTLLGFLFPALSERPRGTPIHTDALRLRRPLITALRLNLAPGDYSRAAIESLVRQPPIEIAEALKQAYDDDRLGRLLDRLDHLYGTMKDVDHVTFWKGVAAFLRKPDCEWMASYSPMHDVCRNFANVLDNAVRRDERMRDIAANVFVNLRNSNEDVLTAMWLRSHFFRHGLFGQRAERSLPTFLNEAQTEALARDMSVACRALQMAGKLIPCRWDLQPVYTMIDMGIWDDQCRKLLDETLESAAALDGFTLMLFGRHFMSGNDTISKMCDYEMYLQRVRARLASPEINAVDESVRDALNKAVNNPWV